MGAPCSIRAQSKAQQPRPSRGMASNTGRSNGNYNGPAVATFAAVVMARVAAEGLVVARVERVDGQG